MALTKHGTGFVSVDRYTIGDDPDQHGTGFVSVDRYTIGDHPADQHGTGFVFS